MLRTLQSPNYRPKLLGARFDTQDEVYQVNPGIFTGAIPTAASGETTLTLAKPFARQCVPFVSSYTGNVADGHVAGIEEVSLATSASQFRVSALQGGGAADPGSMYALIAGWDSPDTSQCLMQAVKTNITRPRLIAMSVDGTGTASITRGSGQATLTDNGTGNYTLTYTTAFGCAEPLVYATCKGVDPNSPVVESSTSTGCEIQIANQAGTATDADFDIVILGNDGTPMDSGVELQRSIQCPWRKPVMLAFTIDVSGGTPSLTIGGEFATITDIGVGNYSIDLKADYQFAATPVVLVCANSNNGRANVSSPTTKSSVEIVVAQADGGALQDYGANVLMFGSFRDATEY